MRCFLALVALVFLTSCRPARVNPPVLQFNNAAEMFRSMQIQVGKVKGLPPLPILDTHSMEPLIYGGDYVVISGAPFGDALDGCVVGLRPEWNPDILEIHRVVGRDSFGYLVEGDNVDWKHPEAAKFRMTSKNFVGEVVGIYRLRKQPISISLGK